LKIKIETNNFFNHLRRNGKLLEIGAKARKVNGILGGLCRLHYPGLVDMGDDQLEPATEFGHYALAADAEDRNRNKYSHKVERVVRELRVSLSRTTFLSTSYSLGILLIIN
jgi:hypothetical protein